MTQPASVTARRFDKIYLKNCAAMARFEKARADLGVLSQLSPLPMGPLKTMLRVLGWYPTAVIVCLARTILLSRQRTDLEHTVWGAFFDNSFHADRKWADLQKIWPDSVPLQRCKLRSGLPRVRAAVQATYHAYVLARLCPKTPDGILIFVQLGAYCLFWNILAKDFNQPSTLGCVVVANDHSPYPMAVLALAKSCGLTTAYLQHAPVSSIFPKACADFVVVDDHIAQSHYSGRSMQPDYFKIQLNYDVQHKTPPLASNRIGVALNKLISIEDHVSIIDTLHQKFPKIELKFHPAVANQWSQDARFTENLAVDIIQDSADFTAQSILTSLSGVALELAAMGHQVITVDNADLPIGDYYGFIKYGIVDHATSFQHGLDIACAQLAHNAPKSFENSIDPTAVARFMNIIEKKYET